MRWGSGAVVLYPGILLDSNGMESNGMESNGMEPNGIHGLLPRPGPARMRPPGQRVKHSRVLWSRGSKQTRSLVGSVPSTMDVKT